MTERKFTDEEVIRALELHSKEGEPCLDECPYADKRYCGSKMAKDALDLINRQRAEIEAWETGQKALQKNLSQIIRAEAIKDFPFLRPTTRTTSRNCRLPLSSTIPKIAEIIAFCQTSSFRNPGASGPSVWKQCVSTHSIAAFALCPSKKNCFSCSPFTKYSYKSVINRPVMYVPFLIP